MSPHPDSTLLCLDLFPSLLSALEKGNGNPLQYACLGNHMACCSPWVHKESDNDLATKSPLPLSAFVVVSSLSCVQLFVTPWTAAHQASLSSTVYWSLLKPHVHCVGDAIQPSHCLLPPSPPAFSLPQHQGLFQWVDSASGGQSIRPSASTLVLPMNIQG